MLPINNWSISVLPCARGPGRPIWDWICVMYIGQSLFLIMSCTWINNEVKSVSSGINSVVSICKITLSAYCESETILRGSLKSFRTMTIAYNSAYWTEL